MKEKNARNKALKITIVYFIVGCAWILVSDKLLQAIFPEQAQIMLYSIAKGLIYVLVTTILIFGLTYPAIKKVLDAEKALKKSNAEVNQSNILYEDLCQEYARKQLLLKSLINSIPDLIFYKDTDGVYLGCNTAFEEFTGKTEQEIIGCSDAYLFSSERRARFRITGDDIQETSVSGKNEDTVEYPGGERVIFETIKTPYNDSDGRVIGTIGISRDITQRKNREETIKYLSYHDPLTGLYNRAYYQEMKAALDRPEYLPISVIIGDINGLKLINDAFGHIEGDRLLREIADIMRQCVSESDVLTRIGGDEFSVLMPNTDAMTVKETADRIRALCTERRHLKKEFYTDMALGYATKSEMSDSLDKTMIAAEDILHRRKLLGMQSLHSGFLASIKATMFEKSNETEEHAERLASLSSKLGKAMGLTEDKLDELELFAMLHDLGKISVDKNILTKTGALTDAEWREIKKHPEVGFRIANSTGELRHIAQYILCHHERWDGAGYPLGLAGENIPLPSRIIAVVDAYDAMTQDRAYRKALTEEEAENEISANAGKQFDPEVAGLFLNIIAKERPRQQDFH